MSERLFSCNSESITAAHVRDHSTAIICFVQKFNGLCFNIGCHVFRNRQHIIFMMLVQGFSTGDFSTRGEFCI